MPAKLSEAFRLPITEAMQSGTTQNPWAYSAVGSNANMGAGPMNYQPMPPMQPPPPYQSIGPGPHVPAAAYPTMAISPDLSNTLLFIALGVFFLFFIDMIARRAAR